MINYYNNHVLFCYNYDDLYTEVTKRTSKLGQYRRTDALEHLLTQMSMTKDEEFIFSPYISKACAEVFENIYPLSRGIEDAYRVNTNSVTKAYTALPNPATIFSAANSAITTTIPATNYRQIATTNTVTATNPSYTTYSLELTIKIWYDVFNSVGVERRCAVDTQLITSGTTIAANVTKTIFVAENIQGTRLETYVGNESVTFEMRLIRVNPTSYTRGDYVTYNNDLYKVLRDCNENEDINDTRFFAKLAFDDRNAIIFEINERPWLDKNVFKITDNAIFECIVTFIMADWFKISKVEEAESLQMEYEKNRIDLRHRIQSSGINHKLKSRYF